MPGAGAAAAIERLMERASVALENTKYFEAERLASQALTRAHRAGDFEAMARILLPLQEARRQKRQIAVDAGRRFVVSDLRQVRDIEPGCYLAQPPLLGIDARSLRETADGMQIPVLVIAREPLMRDGRWPVVSVTEGISLRARIDPPRPMKRIEESKTKDEMGLPGAAPPPREWFEAAEEAIGDAGLAKLKPEEPASWRVDDLMIYLDAQPSHEKLHQRLAEECRQALRENLPEEHRHRPPVDDPFSM
jgi:hypothetical protein